MFIRNQDGILKVEGGVSIPFSAGQRLKGGIFCIELQRTVRQKFLSLFQQGKDLKKHLQELDLQP